MVTCMWLWVLCPCFGLLLVSTEAQSVNVTIAYFIVKGTIISLRYERSKAAVDMALEKLPEVLGPDIHAECLYVDFSHDCTPNYVGALTAEMHYEKNVAVIIGPGCSESMLVVGRMAASWNIPIITPGAIHGYLGNKTEFKTLTRIAFTMNTYAKFYIKVLNHFNWSDIAIIHGDDYTVFRIMGESLTTAFEGVGMRVFTQKYYVYSSETMEQFLKKASDRSRVILLSTYGDDLRDLLLTADRLGMTNGEYVFIYFWMFKGDMLRDKAWRRNDELDERAKKAYQSLLVIQLRKPGADDLNFLNFEREVRERALRDYGYDYGEFEVNIFIRAYYDAFIIYANLLKEMIANGEDYRNGTLVSSKLWNHTFPGTGGDYVIDENGERIADLQMADVDPETGEFVIVADFNGSSSEVTFSTVNAIHWPDNNGPPPNEPPCGFSRNATRCAEESDSGLTMLTIIIQVAILLAVLFIVAFLVYRRIKYESDLNSKWWMVKWDDVTQVNLGSTSGSTKFSTGTGSLKGCLETAPLGIYKGTTVVVKHLNTTNIKIDRKALVELKQLRDITCPNLTRFNGLCIDEPHFCILDEHCSRGRLRDMLHNTTVKLDKDFKLSLMNDVVEGVHYIHNSPLHSHGRLNSDNCLIDGRFVLKLANFGIPCIRNQEKTTVDLNKHDLLWLAPEQLRRDAKGPASQAGDVYSFAIVLSELFTRNDPFENHLQTLSIEDVLSKISAPGISLRPTLDFEGEAEVKSLITECWSHDESQRPTLGVIKKRQKNIRGHNGGHILDKLLKRMEQYANNLEGLVDERTQAFLEEKKRSEELLHQVLPKSVADKLRNGLSVEAEAYESVTIYFSDIVGFTAISADSTAMEVVDLLNDLYTCFDGIIENYDVYKVETIGDAYMVVSGLPIRNGDEHVRQIARMSVSIRESLTRMKIRHLPERTLKARIGLHTGPVCAGVVGRKMPRYCLFGDTVNTASRMESNGEAMKIHISGSTKLALDAFGSFELESRGEIPIKGKGLMETFWLLRETHEEIQPLLFHDVRHRNVGLDMEGERFSISSL